ncbi:MAG: hemerythrin family protein [Rhodospirillales bacterium]|nr:hemerythrin family protein [Rhodospirillales bacterium]
MTLLRWRDSLSLNVPIIDADHKRLFELLNRVRFLDLAGDEPQAIADALSELLLYTQTHFRREEKLMELGGYPGLAQHRRYHRFFTEKVAEVMARFRANPHGFRVHDFYELLANWLTDHVLGEDMKIRPYVAHLEEAQVAA